jgi:RNA polymerase sigma-70 factor (ECF subfamily)
MDEGFLAEQFAVERDRLLAVAYRLLGSRSDAEDAVQEAWLRLSRAEPETIVNLPGWLTTVVARISLDMMRSRGRRDSLNDRLGDDAKPFGGPEPEDEAVMADSVGAALIVVLETLSPAERLAFVLRDMFDVPIEDISTVLGRSVPATKMLTSRARQKVRGRGESEAGTDPGRQRVVVDAFLAASRQGDFEALVRLLHPDVVLAADEAAVRMGTPEVIAGAAGVAGLFSGRAEGAQPALVDGGVGMVWVVRGAPRVVWDFAVEDGRVVNIDMLADRETLARMDLAVLDD